jgi:hypothetical protein
MKLRNRLDGPRARSAAPTSDPIDDYLQHVFSPHKLAHDSIDDHSEVFYVFSVSVWSLC